jgi:oligopeptide transport system substrate-binding protein
MKAKWSIFAVLVLVMSLFLAACGGNEDATDQTDGEDTTGQTDGTEGTTEETEPTSKNDYTMPDPATLADEQVLNLLGGSEIPAMDTTQATDAVSFTVMNNVFEGLYRMSWENTPTPGVAESVDISSDGLTYTFNLRTDAVWSNGTPVTAEDFLYAWKKALHPDTLSPYAFIMGPIKNVNAIIGDADEGEDHPLFGDVDAIGVTAPDNHTLVVELEAPTAYFLGLTSFPTFHPQNQAYVESMGEEYALEAENMIYNGPFVLSEWKHDEGWTYTKNDSYWDAETVVLDAINIKIVKDSQTALNLYLTGQVASAGLTSENVETYRNDPAFADQFITTKSPVLFYLKFNQKNEALANVNVRKALSMGWDKFGLTEQILANGSTPAYFHVPTDFVYDENGEDFRDKYGDFNVEDKDVAKEAWAKGLAELGTDTVEVELLNYEGDRARQIGEFLKNQLETTLPGLTVTIKQQPFKQKLALEDAGDYDISFSGWGPDYQDPMTFIDMWVTGGNYNDLSYSNPKFDELVLGAKKEGDFAKRWTMLQDAERILLEDDFAICPMYQRGGTGLRQPWVKNYTIHPFGPDVSYKWTYIEKH